jgi:hypothetical protein
MFDIIHISYLQCVILNHSVFFSGECCTEVLKVQELCRKWEIRSIMSFLNVVLMHL